MILADIGNLSMNVQRYSLVSISYIKKPTYQIYQMIIIWRFPKSWGYPTQSSIGSQDFHDKPSILAHMFSDRVPLYIPKMIISYHIPLSHIHLYHTIRIPMIYFCIPNCFPTSHPYDPCRGWSSPGSASMVRLLVRRWRRAVCRASTSARRAQETRGIRMGSELGDGRMDHSGFIKFYKPKWSI